MNSKKLIALGSAAMMILGLSGCNQTGSDSKDPVISKMLDGLRSGFVLDADVALEGVPHDEVYEPVHQNYGATYIFQNEGMVATERKVEVFEEDGTSYIGLQELLKEGEDGAGYFLDLTYENKLEENVAIDSYGSIANFGLYYGNPFSYITEDDFTKVDDKTYTLSKEKGSFMASRLFGVLDDVFYALIEKTTFKFENETLKSIFMEPVDVDTKIQMGYEIIDLVISATADIKISEIGTAKVNAPTTKEYKSEHDALKTALNNIGENYTIFVKEYVEETNLQTGIESTDTFESHYYFADNFLFYRPGYDKAIPEYSPYNDVVIEFTEDGSCVGYGLDEATNTWTKEALFANGLGNTNSQKENAYRPLISGVAPEVFELDSKTGLYNICSELTPYIGFDCFVPAIQAPQELGGYGTGCSIKLENGTIKEIVLDFYYNNGFRERIGTVTVEFSNVGTTTLPSDITLA